MAEPITNLPGEIWKPVPSQRRVSVLVEGVLHWRCSACKRWLPTASYYTAKRTLCGITPRCRLCHTAQSIRTRDPERARIANRDYARRARARDPERARAKYRDAARTKKRTAAYYARVALNAATRRGAIIRPEQCQQCGMRCTPHGHHHDYAKPLDVEWLCPVCHGARHRKH